MREREISTFINLYYTFVQEADITSTDIQLYWGLFSRFDVSVPFYTAGTAFMVPWPDEESRLLAPIYPFQLTVRPT